MSTRILVVEDDAQVARTVRLALREAGHEVDVVDHGDRVLAKVQSADYDLLILDLLLPGRNGLDVLGALRSNGKDLPVLILTAKSDMQDRVDGLDAGADDYLVKPFGLEELRARVRALLRRRGTMIETRLQAADLELDALRRRVTRAGREISLTHREFDLLEYLMRHADAVVSRAQLAEELWGYTFDPSSNFVDVHIAHLRNKIDSEFPHKLLRTVRGRGYVLQAQGEPEPR